MKKNFKNYNENTISSLFNQLRGLIGKSEKYKATLLFDSLTGKHTARQYIVDVCEDIILHTEDQSVKYWFVNIFSKIIHETGMYYNCLPKNVRQYYRDAFIEKLNSKYFKHLEDNIKDEKILSHLKCLYWAYLQENVYNYKLNKYYNLPYC